MSEESAPDEFLKTLDRLSSDRAWPSIERLVRRSVRAAVDEWRKATKDAPGLRIDARSLVRELSTGTLNAELQQFFGGNHRFIALLAEKNRRAAAETYDFVDHEMPTAMFNLSQMALVRRHKDSIMRLGGHILDLGVYKGGSTRELASIFHDQTIHGFDSFEGLPEDWSHVPKGTFGDVKGVLPDMPDNVRLYKGWFEDTLPRWHADQDGRPISLLRIDCDIYSSTKTIFDVLGSLVQSGTWIVFDELIGYRGFKDHEYKAFMEFKAKSGIEFEYVAFGLTYAMGYVK